MPADLYDVLGTSDDASAEEIKRAYRERVREYHPDVNDHPDGDAQFKLVRKANDVLSDSVERKTYDRLGHREYVDQHLDDLPPVSVFPDEDLPEGTTTGTDSTGSASTGSGTSTTTETTNRTTGTTNTTSTTSTTNTASTASGTSSANTAGGTTGRSGRSSSSGSTSSASTESTDFGGTTSSSGSTTDQTSTRQASASQASTGTQSGTSTDANSAGSSRDSWDAATNASQSTSSESTVPAGVRRRRGLKRWYGVVALSLLTYLTGLGLYVLPRQAALRGFVGDVMVAPVPTLLGPLPLSSPTQYLIGAARAARVGTPELGLVLLAGTVLLPLVVLTTVGRFGRGAAWMYALPSLGPALCFAAWPSVAVPAGVALVGLVVLPILSGGGFLVDVGRYLRATR